MTASKAPGICRHCQQSKRLHLRGLCRMCYEKPDVRERYPAMPRSERIKAIARFGMNGGTENMPTTAYAVCRTIRSPVSGWLNIVLTWFGKLPQARRFVARSCAEIDVRIELWEQSGDQLRQEVIEVARSG